MGTSTLSPGEQIGLRINLTKYFDLSENGNRYTIIVTKSLRASSRAIRKDLVTSNKLEITIDQRVANKENVEEDEGRWTFPQRRRRRGDGGP